MLISIPLLFVALFLLFINADWGVCDNSIVEELQNPTLTKKAVLFVRDCGATTDYSKHISILSPGKSLNHKGGNCFITDSNHGKAPEDSLGGPTIHMKWISPDTLEISHHEGCRIFKDRSRCKGVIVLYNKISSK